MSLTIAKERNDERARIASALHDEVQQALYDVTLHAEVVRAELGSGRLLALEDDIPMLLEASHRARSLLREVIRDLRKSNFGVRGLATTLRLLTEDLTLLWNGRLVVRIEDVGGTPEAQLLIYQIAREALHNAIHHSGASSILVQLVQDGGLISLLVEDDGRGFKVDDVDGEKHFGLEIMSERAQLAGGHLTIDSEPGEGTRISGAFPLGSPLGQ